ncbi:MAG: FHA domain-containing protein [Myxococcales bacterium]|nr:FHA domain-containing protein [Myxococcales bacterium]
MIICPNCSRENEDHYKFCLGCGTEISRSDALPDVPPVATALPQVVPQIVPKAMPEAVPQAVPKAMPEAMPQQAVPEAVAVPARATPLPVATALPAATPAPPPALLPAASTPPPSLLPASASDAAPPTMDEDSLAGDEPMPDDLFSHGSMDAPPRSAPPERVESDLAFEGTVDAESLKEAPPVEPTRVARVVRVDDTRGEPPTERVPEPFASADSTSVSVDPAFDELHASMVSAVREAAGRRCRACGNAVPAGFKFCGVCGSRFELATPSVAPSARVRLTLVHPDGSEGESFELPAGECTVGRAQGLPLFVDDPFLAPRHATFHNGPGRVTVRDEGSLNGVFIRLRAEVELVHRDLFRVGQQLLRFEDLRHVRPVVPAATDGTLAFGSPTRGAWGRLTSLVAVDTPAQAWTLAGPQTLIGRERGEIRFPGDGFVSGSHCVISTRQGRYFLADQGSTNGTYLRLKGEQAITDDDLLLLGQQLFRVTSSPAD